MAKFQSALFRLMAGGFFVTLFAAGVEYLMAPSYIQGLVWTIGFITAIITACLFAIHVVITVFWAVGRMIDRH